MKINTPFLHLLQVLTAIAFSSGCSDSGTGQRVTSSAVIPDPGKTGVDNRASKMANDPFPYMTDESDTISLRDAANLTRNWRTMNNITSCNSSSLRSAHFVKNADFESLTAQSRHDNGGIRIYFGYRDNTDTLHIILASVNSQGRDYHGSGKKAYNFASPCPSICDCNSDLQSDEKKWSGEVKRIKEVISWDTAIVYTRNYRNRHHLNTCTPSTAPKVKGYWISNAVISNLRNTPGANGIRFYFASPSTNVDDAIYLVAVPAFYDGQEITRDITTGSMYLVSDICPNDIYCDSPLAK